MTRRRLVVSRPLKSRNIPLENHSDISAVTLAARHVMRFEIDAEELLSLIHSRFNFNFN